MSCSPNFPKIFLVFVPFWLSFSTTSSWKIHTTTGIPSRYSPPLCLHRHKSNLQATASGTDSNSFVDGLRVQKIPVPALASALNVSEMFYYEISDWQWWDKVSATGEANAVTNPTPPSSSPSRSSSSSSSSSPSSSSSSSSSGGYVVGSFTYGAKLWPACLAVALGMIRDASLLQGLSVLDVGCGVGLASFTAASVGARQVTAVDIAPLTLKLVEKAGKELGYEVNNGDTGTGIHTQVFDIMDSSVPLPPADVCIFADVLYNKPLGRGVARRVHEAKQRGSWVVVGSMKGREGRTAFLEQLVALGVSEAFPVSDRDDTVVELTAVGWKAKSVEILEINRPSSPP